MLSDTLKDVAAAAAIESVLPGGVIGGNLELAETTLEIDPVQIVPVCRFLKNEQGYNRLSGVTAVDWLPRDPRFDIVYHLHALDRKERLRLKCAVGGDLPAIDSITTVWLGADWYEREVFDLFGVVFRNHPDLQRLLMPEGWKGHPLRKDYPVHGFKYSYQNDK